MFKIRQDRIGTGDDNDDARGGRFAAGGGYVSATSQEQGEEDEYKTMNGTQAHKRLLQVGRGSASGH
jgi:hypothetical protein